MDRTGAKIDVNVVELCPKASIIDLDGSCLMELDKDHLNRLSGTIYFVSNLNSGLLINDYVLKLVVCYLS